MKCRIKDLQPGDHFMLNECGIVYKLRRIELGKICYSQIDSYGFLSGFVEQMGANSQRYIIKINETGNAQSDGKRSAEGEPGSDS